jgi:SAM-dependent methyltransferase
MSTDELWTYFYEVFEALPRQGPGERDSTERALRCIPPLGTDHRILDVGCGTGMQTLDLADATEARIVAVDNHPPFVSRLASRIAERGLEGRVTPEVGDMADLPFPDGSFDAIWCEGAIFIIGFARGLTEWRRLLAPGGHMVISEFCWFRPDPPDELVELHAEGCDDVGDVEDRRRVINESGYRLLHDFRLPETAWWEHFYAPMGECLERFRIEHASHPAALDAAGRLQHEIDMYLKHKGDFGYVFFILECDGD